jgi:hypothetical protein
MLRIILWTLACGIGLWLGAGTRTSAAGGQTSRPSAAAQTAIADIFRFDILVAGKEATAQPVRSAAAAEKQYSLPTVVLAAMRQRPEPVPSAMPRTLVCSRPRLSMAPPARPDEPWRMDLGRMDLEASMARVENAQRGMQALLTAVQGLTDADRKSIQVEVDKACAQIDAFRAEPLVHAPEPPEPDSGFASADLPAAWPEPGAQLMPY